MSTQALTLSDLLSKKQRGEKICMLTAYDTPTATLLDKAGVDVLLVGDSLGNTVLGFKNTLRVTLEDMIRHSGAVSRGTSHALVVSDMPFMSYQVSVKKAKKNAGRLLQEAGVHAVKLEITHESQIHVIEAFTSIGLSVMAHVGLTPQSIHQLSGYHLQGKTPESGTQLIKLSHQVAQAGAFSVVLEMISPPIAKQITEQLTIPTIGIGSGPDCDGQVLVIHDVLGLSERTPKFAKTYANLSTIISGAVQAYCNDVRQSQFPPRL